MSKPKQSPSVSSDGVAASRRRRRPSENGEMYVESIGANVPPVPGSSTKDGRERIAHIARNTLDRVRDSIRCRRAAAE